MNNLIFEDLNDKIVRIQKRKYKIPYGDARLIRSLPPIKGSIVYPGSERLYRNRISYLERDVRDGVVDRIYDIKFLLKLWLKGGNQLQGGRIKQKEIFMMNPKYLVGKNIYEKDNYNNVNIKDQRIKSVQKVGKSCEIGKSCPDLNKIRIVSRHFSGLLSDMKRNDEFQDRYFRDSRMMKRDIRDLEDVSRSLADIDYENSPRHDIIKKRAHKVLVQIKRKLKDKNKIENRYMRDYRSKLNDFVRLTL